VWPSHIPTDTLCLSAAVAEGLGTRVLTDLMLRRRDLDLSDNDITSLAGATFAGEIE
jgi:hypothetical protein